MQSISLNVEERILLELRKVPRGCLRRNELLKRLYPEYSNEYTKGSFDVILNRKLLSLCKKREVKREDEGHQKVFYQLSLSLLTELSLASHTVKERAALVQEVAKSLDPIEAVVFLEDIKQSLMESIRFVEDVYDLLPKNAELVASTETEEERERRKAFLKETGGRVQVSIPEKRRE